MQTIRTAAPCPGCGEPMIELEAPVGVFAGCERCGGIWFDNIASFALRDGALGPLAERFTREIVERTGSAGSTHYRSARTTGACPLCRHELEPIARRPDASGVCAPHGAFFTRDAFILFIWEGQIRRRQEKSAARAFARHYRPAFDFWLATFVIAALLWAVLSVSH